MSKVKMNREYFNDYYKKNRDKLCEYQKDIQMKKRKYNKNGSLRGLKSWKTRREKGWNTIMESRKGMDNKNEIKRLKEEINKFKGKNES